jgi:GntR family transcriptional regulator
VRLADTRRVVFSQDFFPAELFSRGGLSLDDVRQYLLARQSLYGLLKERLSLNIHHAMAWLRPVAATPALAQRLHILVGSGLLYIEQVDYDTDNRALVLADEFHVADAFTFTVYRSHLGPG